MVEIGSPPPAPPTGSSVLWTPRRVLFTVMLRQYPDALAPGLAVCANAANAAASALCKLALVFRLGLTLSDFCSKDHLLL